MTLLRHGQKLLTWIGLTWVNNIHNNLIKYNHSNHTNHKQADFNNDALKFQILEELPDQIKSYLSNFEISISNNVTPQYALGSGNLFPFALVTGMRTITGSFSVYNINGPLGVTSWNSYAAAPHGNVQFSLGGNTYNISAEFHRVTPAGQVGPIISTIAFKGIGIQNL